MLKGVKEVEPKIYTNFMKIGIKVSLCIGFEPMTLRLTALRSTD